MSKVYKFTPKQCPFCDGSGKDDRSRHGMDECSHEFTETEYNAQVFATEEMEALIKEAKKTTRAMKKIMDKSA